MRNWIVLYWANVARWANVEEKMEVGEWDSMKRW
jgi:hypothetical protein